MLTPRAPWLGRVCNQQCNDCAPLAIALMLSIVAHRDTMPLSFGAPCAGLRDINDAVADFARAGACAGSHCDVQRLPPPHMALQPAASVRWLRARVRGKRAAAAATFAADYPLCAASLPTSHMVTVIGARGGYLLVQNSYGNAWGANGLAAVRFSRARACRLLDVVVVTLAPT